MPSLQDLNIVEEDNVPDIDPEQLAGQIGSFIRPPQPGKTYRFKLPGDMSDIWETQDTKNGQRIKAVFKDDKALFIETLNEPCTYVSLSSEEQERGKDKKLAADLAYLLTALGETKIPGFSNSKGYVQALSKHSAESFMADVSWSVACSSKKDIWVEDTPGGRVVKKEGTKGCGRVYTSDDPYDSKTATGGKTLAIPQYEDGARADRFGCECGAQLRMSFIRLKNFRAAK